MKRKNQFDQSKIIPAQPGWYACDMVVSSDLKKCIGITYKPIIAWAIAEYEDQPNGTIDSAITLPIFATGGPFGSISSLLEQGSCCLLFYKDPDGNFFRHSEWLGAEEDEEDMEAALIEIYSKLLESGNRG